MNTAGLSLEQAPPISVPFRFFLTAPVYLLIAGLLIISDDTALSSRWTPTALACVHLVALGFMSQIMVGSLFQLLPVLLGVTITKANEKSLWIWLGLNAGVPMMAAGFFLNRLQLLAIGAFTVAGTLLYFAVAILLILSRQQKLSSTFSGIRLALTALIIVVFFGAYLVAALNGWLPTDSFSVHVDSHATVALAGWLGILLASVSYQMAPLFFVTREFPAWFQKTAAPGLLSLLVIYLLLKALGIQAFPLTILIAVIAVAYAGILFSLLRERKRKSNDPAMLYWHLAAACITAAAILAVLQASNTTMAALVLVGVGIVMPSAVLLKIIPFLCWFQLQNKQMQTGKLVMRIPNMKSFIGDPVIRLHLLLLSMLPPALALNLQGVPIPPLLIGLLLMASALVQNAMFLEAVNKYRSVNEEIRKTTAQS